MTTIRHTFLPAATVTETEDGSLILTVDWFGSWDNSLIGDAPLDSDDRRVKRVCAALDAHLPALSGSRALTSAPTGHKEAIMSAAELLGMDPAELTARLLAEPAAVTFTHDQVEAWAGRPLTDDEVQRLDDAIPNSSIPEAVATIVDNL